NKLIELFSDMSRESISVTERFWNMNSTLPSSLNKPSEFYTAVVDGLKAKLSADVDVLRYANFNTQEVQGIQLYVEIGDFGHAIRHPDGRRAQKMRINVHCIVSRGIEEADL
ncbi:hypothetical protein EAY71_23690, partial [Vibrio anguillarum]|nr:hypothetical protein [Vibrio anguillarum]